MESQAQADIKKETIGKLKDLYRFVGELNWFISASIALLAFFLIKRYVADIERVNSDDMRSTYYQGDALFITKINNTYNTTDVVYFEHPFADSLGIRTYYFQRILGLPGDCVSVNAKIPQINGMNLEDTSTVKHNYFVQATVKLDSVFLQANGISEGGEVSNEHDYSFSLTKLQANILAKENTIKKVELKSEKKGTADATCFPYSASYKWNMDNYGALYVPRINDTLKLDTTNIHLYGTLIKDHEKNHLVIKKDSIFINDEYAPSYIVKKNYFFVLGDNRDNANDSRSWGFLPENCIIGKVKMVVRKSKR